MNSNTCQLNDLGQRVWLDGISRERLKSGRLGNLINDCGVTGMNSNSGSLERAISTGHLYDAAIETLDASGLSGEALLLELMLEDVTQAADLLRPMFEASSGADGWISVEAPPAAPSRAEDVVKTARHVHAAAARPNVLIQVPGTADCMSAIEESIFDGMPIEVTLLFSREHFAAAAHACMRGLERRMAAGLHLNVASVASIEVNRWDVAVKEEISAPFHDRLGIAMAMRTYKAHNELLASQRWHRLAAAGARPPRLLWNGTASNGSAARDTFYVEALAARGTITAVSEKTLTAFAKHGRAGTVLPPDGGFADAVLEEFRREGVADEALAARLQSEAVDALAASWRGLLRSVREKTALITAPHLP